MTNEALMLASNDVAGDRCSTGFQQPEWLFPGNKVSSSRLRKCRWTTILWGLRTALVMPRSWESTLMIRTSYWMCLAAQVSSCPDCPSIQSSYLLGMRSILGTQFWSCKASCTRDWTVIAWCRYTIDSSTHHLHPAVQQLVLPVSVTSPCRVNKNDLGWMATSLLHLNLYLTVCHCN